MKGFFSYYLLATIPIAVIFFVVPSELYYPQRLLWNEAKSLPLFFASIGSVIFIFALPLFYFFNRYASRYAKLLALTLGLIGIYILLADVFAPLQSSPLDGFQLVSKEPFNLTLIETFLCLLIVAAPFLIGVERSFEIAYRFSIGLWLLSIAYTALIYLSNPVFQHEQQAVLPRKELKNVYHFVLDELQTDAALSVIKDLKLQKRFDGFTFFPFNTSSYLFTKSSFPNYMTGTTFSNEQPFQDWLNIFKKRGILKELEEHGYQITMNVPWTIWDNEYVSDFRTLDQIMQKFLLMNFPGMGDFFPICLARVLPNFLTNESFSIGVGLEKKLSRVLENTGHYPRTIGEGKEPFSSVLMLKNAIRNERNLSSYGRYSYFHAVLPHGPYVIDGNCKYTRRFAPGDVKAYYQQSVCGLKLVAKFITELKRLKRFNDSIIIVHADTGHGLRGLIETSGVKIISSEKPQREKHSVVKRYPDWNEQQLFARTMSFLAIKQQNAKGQLTISPKFSKLFDLYPTLLRLLEVHSNETDLHGSFLFDENFPTQRTNDYFLYDPRDNHPSIQQFAVNTEHLHSYMNKILGTFQEK